MKPRSFADHWLAGRRRAQAAREDARRDADAKKPRPIVLASNYPGGAGEGGVTGLYRCPEFDGIKETLSERLQSIFAAPASEYHWTREALEAEAERRGVELIVTVFSDMTGKEDYV